MALMLTGCGSPEIRSKNDDSLPQAIKLLSSLFLLVVVVDPPSQAYHVPHEQPQLWVKPIEMICN